MSIISGLSDSIVDLSPGQMSLFENYIHFLLQFNRKLNLVARSSTDDLGTKHIADSVIGLRQIANEIKLSEVVFDFGSGNGFPGMVGAILFPQQTFYLIERDLRKAEFLKLLASHLNLSNVQVHAGSLTDLDQGTCSLAISRAMSPLPRFLLEARSVMAPGGRAFLFKGPQWTTEFGLVAPQMFDHWNVRLKAEYVLPSQDKAPRFLIECARLE